MLWAELVSALRNQGVVRPQKLVQELLLALGCNWRASGAPNARATDSRVPHHFCPWAEAQVVYVNGAHRRPLLAFDQL